MLIQTNTVHRGPNPSLLLSNGSTFMDISWNRKVHRFVSMHGRLCGSMGFLQPRGGASISITLPGILHSSFYPTSVFEDNQSQNRIHTSSIAFLFSFFSVSLKNKGSEV